MNKLMHNLLSPRSTILYLLLMLFFCLPWPGLAAVVSINTDKDEVGDQSLVKATIVIDTEGEQLNAFAGELVFPGEMLMIEDINLGSSLVNLWIEEPRGSGQERVSFSGITPGGYTGSGTLFTVSFRADNPGSARIYLDNFLAVLNDGLGSAASSTVLDKTIAISFQTNPEELTFIDLSDNEAPEAFTPIITKIAEIGGDNYLLLFVAQDKRSGIDYYEVREGKRRSQTATSPYLLKNQALDQDIVITAVDKSGNRRSETISLGEVKETPTAFWYLAASVFALALLLGFSLLRKRKQKK